MSDSALWGDSGYPEHNQPLGVLAIVGRNPAVKAFIHGSPLGLNAPYRFQRVLLATDPTTNHN